MSIRRIVGDRKAAVLSLLLAPAIALACTIYEGVSFDVHVGAVSSGIELGDRLEAALGSQFGVDTSVEGVVRYQARLPFLNIIGGLMSIPFTKSCGQTFKQRAIEIYSNSVGNADTGGGPGGGNGGGGNGSGQYQVVGYTPIYITGTVCANGSCSSQQILIGYTAQWAWVPARPGPPTYAQN
ncbi:hypothetical protein E2F46_06260 [Luteimonas aestuarii]|uniref:Uncharacterized protein n=1 Tax=Luteimonas aestuarii TaxID=453837 RepID=A0A4R5TYA9_9GAMM|nr:hypothetical protein [Luteimonas aestuarii]TDK26198.1 hypothetical protein E2F46_06260 [Luteimonas aestuarii]